MVPKESDGMVSKEGESDARLESDKDETGRSLEEDARNPFAGMSEEEHDSFFRFLERNAVEESPFDD